MWYNIINDEEYNANSVYLPNGTILMDDGYVKFNEEIEKEIIYYYDIDEDLLILLEGWEFKNIDNG